MSAVLGVKEQAVLINLLKREIARIEAQELAFKIATTSPYIDRKRLQASLVKPTSEEIETKNICKKILDDVVEYGASQEKENKMKKYKLKKDTFFYKAGTICTLAKEGHLVVDDSQVTLLFKHELEYHPELLDEWFEKIEEKKYGGRVPKEGAMFYYITPTGAIIKHEWVDGYICKSMFECGSAFWTEEEAEKELARRKAYVILKEDTKGFKPDWKNEDEEKYYVAYSYDFGGFVFNWNRQLDSGEKLYFATEEDAQASVRAHSSEWKTWLGVEV